MTKNIILSIPTDEAPKPDSGWDELVIS